jgi:nicotinamidase-related amidase
MVRSADDVPVADRVSRPALLIVDMQNDFVRVDAPLEVPDARATIPNIARLAAQFRSMNAPVIYTRFFARQEEDLLWLWSPQCQTEVKCCWRGTSRTYGDRESAIECTEIVDELAPLSGEPVIDKYGYGSFHATGLDAQLRALGVQSIVLTGTVSQICVEETGREAFHHGYRTIMVEDGVSSFAPDLQAATLKNFAMKFGWVAKTADVLGWLSQTQGKPEAA